MPINPMEFFNIGEKIGRVNSPASGLAGSLRDILKTARAKGLVTAQAEAQGQSARETALYKNQLEQGKGQEQIPYYTVGQNGISNEPTMLPSNAEVRSLPAPNIFSLIGDDSGIQTPPQAQPSPVPSSQEAVQDEQVQQQDFLQRINALIKARQGQ